MYRDGASFLFGPALPRLSRKRSSRLKEDEWSEHLDGYSTASSAKLSVATSERDIGTICWDNLELPVLLVLIGVSSALVSYLTSLVLELGNLLRDRIVGSDRNTGDFHFGCFVGFCCFATTMGLLSCFLSHTICKESVGGGLPDMKTILGGVVKPILLSKRLIAGKMLGLWFALLAGLSVGKEGPYVQISGAIADQLMRLGMFRHLRLQDAKRLEIIACACASGVSATFGNAFGGVLFSIEFTASAYRVSTLPKAFLTSVVAMLVFLFMGVTDQLTLFTDTSTSLLDLPQLCELLSFIFLGLTAGAMGVIFVTLVELLSTARNRLLDNKLYPRRTRFLRRYLLVGVTTLVVSAMKYYELLKVPYTGHGPLAVLEFLFSKQAIKSELVSLLGYFFLYKFLVTVISVTLPLPVGLFSPVFVTGAVLGRIVGELVAWLRPSDPLSQWALYLGNFTQYAPWEYSVLGAAAFATGVTRGISTAVIIFELTGQPHLGLPIAVVVLTAYFIGNLFSKNVYDVLIDSSGRPYMEDLPESLNAVPVAKVMAPIHDYHVLALDSTFEDALNLLNATESDLAGLRSESSDGIYVSIDDDDSEENEEQSPQIISPAKQQQNLLDAPSLPRIAVQEAGNIGEAQHLLSPLPRGPSHHVHFNATAEDRATSEQESKVQKKRTKLFKQAAGRSAKYYAPNVIPIVQSKQTMVIVGAVLREDVREALFRLLKMSEFALQTPMVLGRSFDASDPLGQRDIRDTPHSTSYAHLKKKMSFTFNGPGSNGRRLSGSGSRFGSYGSNGRSGSVEMIEMGNSEGLRMHSAMLRYSRSYEDLVRVTGANLDAHLQPEVDTPITLDTSTQRLERSSNSKSISAASTPVADDNPGSSYEMDQMPYTEHLQQTIQYIIISNGGRSIVPVVNAARPDPYQPQMFAVSSLPLALALDPSPYQVVDTMELNKVDLVFRLLSLNQAYVTNSGRVVGIITRALLRDYIGELRQERHSWDRCVQLWQCCVAICGNCAWCPRDSGYNDLEGAEERDEA